VSLTIKRKIEVIKKLETGCKKRKEIAEEYGVSPSCITNIIKEKETLKTLYYSGEIDPKISRPKRPLGWGRGGKTNTRKDHCWSNFQKKNKKQSS
jgi:hypothetical protein